ncbi:MAG: lysophospholipid acyltransferase family protein [Phycisphaerales bacterium]|nr:lysophospholipid acyltransferase family protein [Phycisphaerales bacterium]
MSCFLTLSGCRMKVYGKENIKKDVQYIIAFNHNSFMDVMFGLPFLPIIKGTKFLSKKSMMLVPFLNIIFASGAVLIDRKSKESRNTSIVKMKYILENYKLSMAIYPEGSRNRTDVPLTKFYNGAFTIAVETKLQILPVLLFNTTEPFPPDKFFYLWPANMEMHILPPHDPYNIDVEQLRDNVFHTMYTYYEKHDKVLSKNN